MKSEFKVKPTSGPVDFTFQPPGSKSISNRALICAALARGTSTLSGFLFSDDTRVMIDSLKKLGVEISENQPASSMTVAGCGGHFPNSTAELFVDNSGTTIRFLTAVLGLHGGNYCLSGAPRMHERPIAHLVAALNELGAKVQTQSAGGCPPVQIEGDRITGGFCKVDGNISSQYSSGLMLASPLAAAEIRVEFVPPLVSTPYLAMTQKVMQHFGVDLELKLSGNKPGFNANKVSGYQAIDYAIEPDASAASYFWAIPAICGGKATVNNLGTGSLQGDVQFVDCLQQMGCEVTYSENSITVEGKAKTGIEINMAHISDTAQTLAAVALFVNGPTIIRGVEHNRVKETDRIGNLAIELRKLGACVDEYDDGLKITPGKLQPAKIETYNDHRMAMSMSLVGLANEGVVICDPTCTSKTYPGFFEDLNLVTEC